MRKFVFPLLLIALACFAGAAQQLEQVVTPLRPAVKLADARELDSKLMARKMPYLVVTPGRYSANSVDRFPVIYLLHGLTGSHKNWVEKTKLLQYATNAGFIVVTPEGNNGWYSDSVTIPNDKYESYIVKELIPEIDAKFRTVANRENRIMAGLSMGGYGGLKFGLKYPELFSLAGSFSGALSAASFTEKNATTAGRGIDAIMGPEGSTGRTSNDLFKLVRDLTPDKLKALPFIYQSCGNEDFLIQSNRDFMALLVEKKVPHEYRQHPGVHDWVFWDDQIREFLGVAERRMKK